MKIVIDISDEEYEDVKKVGGCYYDFGKAIYYGIPLPKGHGRLIDADALGEKLHKYTEAPYQYALTVFNESPTIIKADSEIDE